MCAIDTLLHASTPFYEGPFSEAEELRTRVGPIDSAPSSLTAVDTTGAIERL